MIGADRVDSSYPPMAQSPPIPSPMAGNELRSLFADALPHRWPLAVASILMLAQSATSLTLPWLAGELTLTLLGTEGRTFVSS
jgi:hypothetical protein